MAEEKDLQNLETPVETPEVETVETEVVEEVSEEKFAKSGKKSKKQYTFVFLTQPFKDWADDYNELLIKHETLLPQIFKILSYYGKTIIKVHKREHYNYEHYIKNDGEHV